MSVSPQLADARLYLLVTQELCATSAEKVIEESLANGVDVIQLREKSLGSQAFLEYARQVRRLTLDANALLIINDRPDIAALCDADGVHLGQEDFSVADARKIIGPDKLIGRSTHSLEQAQAAVLDGADYLGVGPVFSSGTKEFSEQAGLEYVRQAAAEIAIPWFAIGGITEENVDQVLEAGAKRIAVCGAICGASEPGYAASRLAQKLKSSRVKE
jgi:thiamine-phosphate pyrophosphorylase